MKKRKKNNLGTILVMLGSLVSGGVFGFYLSSTAVRQGMGFGDYMWTLLWMALGLYVVVFAQIGLHELGHLIGGLLSGYGFSSFRLGSFMLLKENGKLRLRRFSIPGTGGQCLMIPPEPVDGKIPFTLYGLGGVIMNTGVTLIALILWAVLEKGTMGSVLLMMAALFGAILALSNGLPVRMGNVDNDGCNVLTLKKHPNAMAHYIHQMQISDYLTKGIRVKDMPADWFAKPELGEMTDSMTATAGVFAANRLMDEHHFAEARDWMEQMLEADTAMTELHSRLTLSDLIFCELIGENRPEKLNCWLDKEQKQFMQVMKKSISILRTEYAIAILMEKDTSKAENILTQFEKQTKHYPCPQDAQSERELLELVKASTTHG